jgi:hypothetical protein
MSSEGRAEDGVAKPLRVDYGDTRRKLGSSDTEHADVERASGELGRWASTTPARNEEGVTEHLVGGLLHRVTNAQQCGPERGQVLLAHGAQVGVDPCHHGAPRRALAAHGLVRAFLPRLLNVQQRAQLAILAVQLGDRTVAGGGEAAAGRGRAGRCREEAL